MFDPPVKKMEHDYEEIWHAYLLVEAAFLQISFFFFALIGRLKGLLKMMQFSVMPDVELNIFELARIEDETLQSIS